MPPANGIRISTIIQSQIYKQYWDSLQWLMQLHKNQSYGSFQVGRAATKSKYVNSLKLLKSTESNSNNCADKSDRTPWPVDTTPQQAAKSVAEYNSSHTDVFELLRSWASVGKNPAGKLVIPLDKVELAELQVFLHHRKHFHWGMFLCQNPQTKKPQLYSNCKHSSWKPFQSN